jgi:hypothetical protein
MAWKGVLRVLLLIGVAVARLSLALTTLLFEFKELIDLLREFQEFVSVLLARGLLAKRNNLS